MRRNAKQVETTPEPAKVPEQSMRLFTFIGTGDKFEDALDGAQFLFNEWLKTHAWQDESGRGSYQVGGHAAVVQQQFGELYYYVITAYGPAEETGAADA